MAYLWGKLSNMGVELDQDYQLQRRIVLSNRLGMLISAISFVFFVINLVNPTNNLWVIGGIIGVGVSVMWLNKAGLSGLSRLIVCLLPAVGILVVNLILKKNHPLDVGVIHYVSPRMVAISVVVMPFALFSVKELGMLIVSLVLIFMVNVLYTPLHHFMSVTFQDLNIPVDHYGVVYEDIIIMTVILVSSSFFLLSLNKQFAFRNQNLLKEAQDQNESMRANESRLTKTLKEVELARKEDEKRNWASNGHAQITQILQANEEMQVIYDTLISKMVKYLGANQGGLYLVDNSGSEEQLYLTACYAYSRKKYLERKVKIGEGLIGQTYLEKETILLKEIPDNYIVITSGLGHANPRFIAIVPLISNGKVEGILELAFFKEVAPYQVAFIESVGENIAVAIASLKVEERTKSLLERTQVQTEQLRAQEEEMRQSMEELTATQEEMERKEKEYIAMINDLTDKLATYENVTSTL